MEIRKLSDKESNIINYYINSTISKYTDDYVEAVYINTYRIENNDYIDIQFVKNNINIIMHKTIKCPINNIIIRKIDIPAMNYSYGLMHYRERMNAKDLLNSDIIMDKKDEYYKSIADEAKRFEFGEYSNNVTFQPPLRIKKLR